MSFDKVFFKKKKKDTKEKQCKYCKDRDLSAKRCLYCGNSIIKRKKY